MAKQGRRAWGPLDFWGIIAREGEDYVKMRKNKPPTFLALPHTRFFKTRLLGKIALLCGVGSGWLLIKEYHG
jgi:hypothetical protein